jgi:hypothetical protein
MEWSIVYLILSIVALVIGIWNLAQRKTFILALMSVVWFLVILFQFYIKDLYRATILPGLSLGHLLLYLGLPGLLIFGFLSSRFTK